MTNHPNRSKTNPHPSRNPRPEEVIAARKARGLTQTEAGRVVHASLGAWQQWEAGERRMHPAFWELFKRKTRVLPVPVEGEAAQVAPDVAPAPVEGGE